jgi:hypothetical protein
VDAGVISPLLKVNLGEFSDVQDAGISSLTYVLASQ